MIKGYVPDSQLPVKRGDVVRIRKGTPVATGRRNTRLAGRTYTVKVHHVLPGIEIPLYDLFNDRHWELYQSYFSLEELFEMEYELLECQQPGGNPGNAYRPIPITNPRVVWAGTGGYWTEADINTVELV